MCLFNKYCLKTYYGPGSGFSLGVQSGERQVSPHWTFYSSS